MERSLAVKPCYTLSEELIGAISHGIGALLAIAGMVLCIVKFASYLIMGWAIIGAIKQIYNSLDFNGVLLLILGGVIYTIGAIVYGFGKKVKYMHSIWHIFVLAGSILQFFSIYLYVL